MFDRTNLLVLLVAVVGAGLGLLAGTELGQPWTSAVPEGMTVLKAGDMRADLALPDLDGKPHRLSEWDGKLVLVNFWATWCEPCREEMPLLDHTRVQHAKDGLEIVGIAIDDPGAVGDYLKDNPVGYPILISSDDNANPSVAFGDTHSILPYSVLLGRDGRIVAQRSGSFSSSSISSWLQPYLAP
jgi:thiol-disulfide isomerase/thioredoxin